ncbi:Gfo/Idh/MocA family protein [Limosilactobacillus walteri]|uniref:Gfo/Idh/MocA family oxidoreductase n=1 Tax=Limosilactobacillus walteri TaxID=2268022 RepID=A0ABR8P5U1_9LACO|nr:Gfo/Idh/MocA family oxidoreductase [Limosilactobacillus walteri]MBD5806084.1 gfo/Idh/MocA family oxidoreductase [Limosilactobacillus walteri]
MLRLGIIGTHTISDQMIHAAQDTGKYQLTAVYSRKLSTAKVFGKKYGARFFFDNLHAFMHSGTFDVVYIASPNSLHYQQAALAIKNNLYVIVEKPAFVNPQEFAAIEDLLAAHPQARLVEAARHIHTPLFHSIQQQLLQMGHIQGAEFYAMKYSSRYDHVFNQPAPYPNIFRRKFAGGALMDMGGYGIYAAVALFGKPLNVNYFATLSKETTIDLKGTALLQYPNYNVIVNTGKTTTTHNNSEIYGLRDTLVIDSIFDTKKVTYSNDHGDMQIINNHYLANTMTDELNDFAAVFTKLESPQQQANYQHWLELAKIVNMTLYRLRKSANIVFPSDY